MRVYLGDPGNATWLSADRSARVRDTLAISGEILKTSLAREQVYWAPDADGMRWTGYLAEVTQTHPHLAGDQAEQREWRAESCERHSIGGKRRCTFHPPLQRLTSVAAGLLIVLLLAGCASAAPTPAAPTPTDDAVMPAPSTPEPAPTAKATQTEEPAPTDAPTLTPTIPPTRNETSTCGHCAAVANNGANGDADITTAFAHVSSTSITRPRYRH